MQRTLILGIGAQRAGSTWLFDYLARYPAVFGGPIKEFHFWDEYFVDGGARWRVRLESNLERREKSRGAAIRERATALKERLTIVTPEDYFAYFDRHAGSKSFVLDITPSYALMSRDNFRVIAGHAAKAGYTIKVVFVMRDPVDRHKSSVQFRAHQTGNGSPNVVRAFDNPKVVGRGRYDVTLEAVRSVFDKDDIAVGFFEHITRTPDVHLRALVESLGLSYIAPAPEQRTNASPAGVPLTDEEVRLGMATFAPVYAYVNREFPNDKPASWRA
jgi:hypothetical protein